MRTRERIPLHDHRDLYSGGRIATTVHDIVTVTSTSGGTASGTASMTWYDEGSLAGTASIVNVVGSGGTVAVSGGTATLTVSGGTASSGLVVQEVDGSPSGTATVLVLPNTTLSISGGTATYTPAGGSGANADHPLPLDSYAIDGTYGDDFTAASLSGIWTRRNYTSGAETYQVGPKSTWLKISTASRSAGDGYYQTAPAGDWTFGMAFAVMSSVWTAHWGLMVVDSSGNGVGFAVYQGSPVAPLMQAVTTYTTTSGTYYEPWYGSSGSPNAALPVTLFKKFWLYLRKSSTSYYCAMSIDGETWTPEGGPISWAGTVDRVAMGNVALAGTSMTTNEVILVDWFNKIA